MNNIIVPDANVFLEMIYGRQLQATARQLISHAIANKESTPRGGGIEFTPKRG